MSYFAIGIENTKKEYNIGTLWRSAYTFGASYIFTIGRRYKKQSSDTPNTWKKIPLFHYDTFEQFYENIPYDCKLIGIELEPRAVNLSTYGHPKRAIYLLGAEDHGLTNLAIEKCHDLIKIPINPCLNVSVVGSIVMYDRFAKYEL